MKPYLHLLLPVFLLGCPHNEHDHRRGEHGHDHSEAHPAGHDHHESGHGHGDGPVVGITAWSETFELFAEHPVAVVGQPLPLLAHLTVLEDFSGLDKGTVRLELSGPAKLEGSTSRPLQAGIYRPTLAPEIAGRYTGRLVVEGPTPGEVGPIEIEVYADEATARAAVPAEEEHDDGQIQFLKEQQWKVPFGTAFARRRRLVPTIEVAGRVRTPPNGRAEVGAPVAGRIVAPESGLPSPWTRVRKGALLATLSPTPSSPEASVQAGLLVAEAEARASAANVALARAQRLFEDQAVPRRELEDAQREAKVAAEAVRAAQRAFDLYAGATRAAGRGTWRLVAPISGLVESVETLPGAAVTPGQALFRIVDPRELWIVAQVPEQDAARLRTDVAARVRPAGLDAWTELPLAESGVAVGRTVDEISRTVEVIYPIAGEDPRLRVGGLVSVALPVDRDFEGVVVPRGAVIDREGRYVVYVQADGEHFEERAVRTGPRSGRWVGIAKGLTEGERVVVEGARLVRLAEGAAAGGGHGHIH